jgi:aminoglycoside phosphotransferase
MSEIARTNTEFISWATSRLEGDIKPVQARSGAHSTVFELKGSNSSWYLKVGDNLKPELERLKWLDGKLPIPKVIDFSSIGRNEMLLMTSVEGTDLAHLSSQLPRKEVVSRLAASLRAFHAIDPTDCPFPAYKDGATLVHGDACLPNFIFRTDGELSGYIDLGDMGVGPVDVDLSAAVWSLDYNLGPGHGPEFLRLYGYEEADEEEAHRLRNMYEHSPIFDR